MPSAKCTSDRGTGSTDEHRRIDGRPDSPFRQRDDRNGKTPVSQPEAFVEGSWFNTEPNKRIERDFGLALIQASRLTRSGSFEAFAKALKPLNTESTTRLLHRTASLSSAREARLRNNPLHQVFAGCPSQPLVESGLPSIKTW